jgi:CubicO group peptidase (beta-lactamase class C family)
VKKVKIMKKEKEFLDLLEDYMRREIFPGVNIAFVENETVHEFVLGKASILPEVIPLEAGKQWDLASVTKVVGTGTAVINLVFAGKIKLDEPLKKYYSAVSDETVTIRQLLTHTSGIDPFIPNRDKLDHDGLREAINTIKVSSNKDFKYTDINFILLGFLLEEYYHEKLDEIFKREIFGKWQMNESSFGPVENAVPTSLNVPTGTVHDPKAQVLGVDCGAAGLFSTVNDLVKFVQGYFNDRKYLELLKNYATGEKQRSLAWDLPSENKDWLLHTGYTGTFILLNPRQKKAIIFLSNRVHLKDEREKWIIERDKLIKFLLEE